MDLFGINFPELTVIMLVALIIFGPDKLPEIMRTAGRYVAKIRSLGEEAKNEVSRELNLSEVSKIKQEFTSTFQETKKEIQTARESMTEATNDIQSTIQQVREQYIYSSQDIDTMKSVPESTTEVETKAAVEQAAPNIEDKSVTDVNNINSSLYNSATPETEEFSWQTALSNPTPPPKPKWRGEEPLSSPDTIIQDLPPAPFPSQTEGAADGGQARQGVSQ
jgi:sec-independent protein translocase protein TatB